MNGKGTRRRLEASIEQLEYMDIDILMWTRGVDSSTRFLISGCSSMCGVKVRLYGHVYLLSILGFSFSSVLFAVGPMSSFTSVQYDYVLTEYASASML